MRERKEIHFKYNKNTKINIEYFGKRITINSPKNPDLISKEPNTKQS